MKYIALFIFILLAGCGSSSSSGVKDATGETPVKYVICSPNETGCFIAARFKDIAGCESHKEWADMLCDSYSQPGQMICKQHTDSRIGVGYCTL
jgi:hypothetical protein